MAFLRNYSCVDEASGTYGEEVSFVGSTLEDTDTEMRQWIMRTMPLGSYVVTINTTYTTDGQQHYITLVYICRQRREDRVEPKGLLHSGEG